MIDVNKWDENLTSNKPQLNIRRQAVYLLCIKTSKKSVKCVNYM